MPIYEIPILYKGQCTYLVDAETAKQAESKAVERYANGEPGDATGADWESLDRVLMATTIDSVPSPDRRRVTCDSCDWMGSEEQALPALDLLQRIDPGGEVPVGECPQCGCLCYLIERNHHD